LIQFGNFKKSTPAIFVPVIGQKVSDMVTKADFGVDVQVFSESGY